MTNDSATDGAVLKKAAAQIEEYLEGKRTSFNLPLDAEGSEFATAAAFQKLFIPSDATDQRAEDIQKFMTDYGR